MLIYREGDVMDRLPDFFGYDCYDYVPIDYKPHNEDLDELKDMHKMLLECSPLEVIKGYCWDVTFDIENGEFIGFYMLVDPTFKIYLSVGGGEGYLTSNGGRYEIPIDDKLNTALFETVETLYKHGVSCEEMASA